MDMEAQLPEEDNQAPEPARRPDSPKIDYYKDRNWGRKLLISLLVIGLLAAAAGGLYWLKKHHKTTVINSGANNKSTSSQAAQSNSASQISATTKHYDSPNFYLGIDYPANWTLTDNGGGKMTIISPKLQLKAATGQNTDGQIVLTITAKGQNLSAFSAGNAVAVLDSQKAAYTKPTQTQRANTYLSFLQYASTTTSGALDGVYITGDLGYQRLQNVPKTDIAQIDPEIALSFLNASGQPLSIASSSWSDSSLSGPLTKMLTSLAIN